MANIEYKDVVISSGSSESSALDLEQFDIIGIRVPATITGTTLTIKTSDSNTGTFNGYYLNGVELSYAISGGEDIQFSPPLSIARSIKVDTGTNEGADRTFQVITRPFQ